MAVRPQSARTGGAPYFFFFGFLVSFFGLLSLATEILPYVEIILACGVRPCLWLPKVRWERAETVRRQLIPKRGLHPQHRLPHRKIAQHFLHRWIRLEFAP